MKTSEQKSFTSSGFVLGLFLLLLNDFYLKSAFSNDFTGKLSDFAGLFIFPIFWTVFFPKYKNAIYLATALFFVYWKSVYSEGFIDMLNVFLPVSRVVDFSDNMALIILPFSYFYMETKPTFYLPIKPVFVTIIALFSFVASSYDTNINVSKKYNFSSPKDSLLHKMLLTSSNHLYFDVHTIVNKTGCHRYTEYDGDSIQLKKVLLENLFNSDDTIYLRVQDSFCFGHYEAKTILKGDKLNSELLLFGFFHTCPDKGDKDKKILLQSFENKVIKQLQ